MQGQNSLIAQRMTLDDTRLTQHLAVMRNGGGRQPVVNLTAAKLTLINHPLYDL